jgi:hypothetical protein
MRAVVGWGRETGMNMGGNTFLAENQERWEAIKQGISQSLPIIPEWIMDFFPLLFRLHLVNHYVTTQPC